MAEEILDGYDPSEHLEELKNNPPVEPVEGDLEDYQYESAKAVSYTHLTLPTKRIV